MGRDVFLAAAGGFAHLRAWLAAEGHGGGFSSSPPPGGLANLKACVADDDHGGGVFLAAAGGLALNNVITDHGRRCSFCTRHQ